MFAVHVARWSLPWLLAKRCSGFRLEMPYESSVLQAMDDFVR